LNEESASGSRPLPLERAQATVAALIRGSLDQLPSTRMQGIAVEKGSILKLAPPDEADDYPDQSDLLFAFTSNVELFQAIHGGGLFTSACHSKVGELLCYLKIDHQGVPPENLVAFRSQFEDALSPALIQADVGCCIGGGTGVRYAYIELALTNLAKGAQLVRQILAQQKAPLRTWLLFHDDDLSAEWVGIYPQTPEPPREAEDE
jgi:hypothetical protein